jgi:huntingtin
MSSKDITLVVGNGRHGSITDTVSLHDLLLNSSIYLGYSGITTSNLTALQDDKVSVRYQAVFISNGSEFCTEVYSHNTLSDQDPRNMLLLVTPQGTSVQLDGRDCQRLYYHSVGYDGAIHRYWLEAEKSEHRVGQAQHETTSERNDAIARGKSVALQFGPPALGRRFNAQLLIQVPLQQDISAYPPSSSIFFGIPSSAMPSFGGQQTATASFGGQQTTTTSFGGPPSSATIFGDPYTSSASFGPVFGSTSSTSAPLFGMPDPSASFAFGAPSGSFGEVSKSFGEVTAPSFAARVSRGTKQDIWNGVVKKNVKRDPTQCITVTVTLYYTIPPNSIPTPNDIKAAISDLNQLYTPNPKEIVPLPQVLPLPPDISFPLPSSSNYHLLKCPANHTLYPKNNSLLTCELCNFIIRFT